jgi:hypothetical protein
LPSTTWPPEPATLIALDVKPWMTSPRTVLPFPVSDSPTVVVPLSSTRPAGDCVVPSRTIVVEIAGRLVAGAICGTPAVGIANVMVSAPASAFASMMAWRSEPAPESAVVFTTNVAALAVVATTTSASTMRHCPGRDIWDAGSRRGGVQGIRHDPMPPGCKNAR